MQARAKSDIMIKAKIFAGYGLLIVLTVFISIITHRSFQNLTQSADRLAEPNKNIIMLHDIIFSLYQAESHIRTYTLTQEEEFLNFYFEELELIENLVDSLYVLSENDMFFSQRVDSISLLLHEKINLLEEFIELKSENANSVFYELALNKISKVQMPDPIKSKSPDTLLVARAPSGEIAPDDDISESDLVVSDQKDERKNLFRRVRDLFAGRDKDDEIHEENAPENMAGTYEMEQVIISTTGADGINLKKDIEAILNNVKRIALQHQRRITELENQILIEDKKIMDQIWSFVTLLENYESQKATLQAIEAHDTVKTSSNTIIWVLLLGFLILITFLWMISYDIARSRYYKRQLEAEKDRAENLVRIKQRFMANMSHEVRTPLGAIIGFTNQMQQTKLDNKQTVYAEAIQKSSQHLLGIVNDILDFSKIEAGKLVLENIPLDIKELLSDVHKTLYLLAKEKGIKFSVDYENLGNSYFYGDPLRLRQVLINLAGNALKFTEEGFVKISVEDHLNPDDPDHTFITFTIQDSGPGIQPDKQKEIFEEFAQAETHTTRKHGGTGLGLSISSRLVELMKGKILLESEPGKGATFIIAVKLLKQHDPPVVITESNSIYVSDATRKKKIPGKRKNRALIDNAGQDNDLPKLKVLLVEDKCTNQMLISMMLSEMGCHVELASNGQVALDKIVPGKYEVIFMDIQMPVLDGVATLKKLKEMFTSEQLPYIIGLSGKAMKGDAEYYISLGMDDYLTKPVTQDTILDCLQRWSAKVNG